MTSSLIPGMLENSCETSEIRTEVTVAPSSEESSTRRSALPSVIPYPLSSGLSTNRA